MSAVVQFSISYSGKQSDDHIIDFYDVSDALVGFQRYLALTTHFLLNGEIITQAPKLKKARIYALPAEEGSWKFTVNIAMLGATLAAVNHGIFVVGTADKDTPIGNLGRSVYEYVVSELTGVNPDYEKTIGKVYREEKAKNPNFPDLSQHRLDSLTEKCQGALLRMHRPIVASKTAKKATLRINEGSGDVNMTGSLDKDSYDYMAHDIKDKNEVAVVGRVTSYNVNTYKGRIYLPAEKRPIPFVLSEYSRDKATVDAIIDSLSATARDKIDGTSDIKCFVYRTKSRSKRLKSLLITNVLAPPQQ